MSDVTRQKRLFFLVLLLFALFFVVGYTSRLVKKSQMEQAVRTWQERIVRAEQKNFVLEADLAHVQSEAYVHEKARELLGLVQPEDTLIVEVEQPSSAGVEAAAHPAFAATAPPVAPPGEVPKWQQWLRLFWPAVETAVQP